MPSACPPRIAVIGAGITGLACASRLAAAGLPSVVFDKSRGLGGRIATRRASDGLTFDHGAQFATARGPAFAGYMRDAMTRGAARLWTTSGTSDGEPRYLGSPGMSALVRPLAENLDIRSRHTLTSLRRSGCEWQLSFAETARTEVADIVALCLPAPQVGALVQGFPDAMTALSGVEIAPCWALMVAFETAGPAPALPDVLVPDAGPLSWIASESAKPGRTDAPPRLVLHASAKWSTANLELGDEAATRALLAALRDSVGMSLPGIAHASAHRWRHAKTLTSLGAPFLSIEANTLFAGGDWCLGARVECGFDSGFALAERIAETVP
ncbi:NAD(P)/FAD-dependent oxidoreductase [Stappia stellulata]|uniref:NAD(P)/FAD-dependent oxidoreductase n=1 Tax=Stappia stellulata TaxID=71235 RepID=UPI0003F7D3E3|nr:FAD-dependent oxidoreductase [Stappia stellulata]